MWDRLNLVLEQLFAEYEIKFRRWFLLFVSDYRWYSQCKVDWNHLYIWRSIEEADYMWRVSKIYGNMAKRNEQLITK